MAVSQQQAAAALQKAGVSVFGLQVEDTGASIALRGTVATEAEKQKAEQALRQATDTQVANYLEVQTGADSASGGQTYTVKPGDNLRKIAEHFYGDEMGPESADPGQDPRGAPDLMPVWTLLDLTPQGRGTDWYPKLEYGAASGGTT